MTQPPRATTLAPILISVELGKELALLMRHLGRAEAVVDGVAVQAVEVHRRISVPPPVLAYMAASGEPMRNLVVLDEQLDAFFLAEGRPLWKAHARFAHVSFTAWGDWPRSHAVFDATGALSIFSLKTASFEPGTMSDILRARWPEVDFDAATEVVCAPAVSTALPPPARHVAHRTFGKGTVLAEEDGKLRIDFGAAGVKTLLAKFVTDVAGE
jgi:hypothetical protein